MRDDILDKCCPGGGGGGGDECRNEYVWDMDGWMG